MSLQEVYAQLAPEQRAAIAQQFQAALQQSAHPDAQQLGQIDPQAASAEDVAKMHGHAVQHDKGALGVVLRHPVVAAALAAFAVYELDKHLGKK
jgi:hypothetical protein